MKRPVLGAGVVALAAVLVAGCGGGSKTLSKEEYGSQLNQICADYNAKQQEIGTPTSLEELASKGAQLLDEFKSTVSKAKQLKAPDEIKDQADRFIALGEQQTGILSDVVDAAKANDAAKVQELGSQIDPIQTESDGLADQLGVPACKGSS